MGEIIFVLLVGFVGGFAGGLLGIGGGAIYIPAMVLILDEPQHVAQGMSLAAIVATALVGALTHLRRGNVDVGVVAWVAPAAIVTGLGAAFLADALDPSVLRRIFAVVALYFSITMIVSALRTQDSTVDEQGGS